MPDVVTNPKIFINAPGGSQLIDNPLYNYTFHPLVPSDLPDVSVKAQNQTAYTNSSSLFLMVIADFG